MFFESLPTIGDIIFADRGLYKHYGVYVGEGRVIHFSAPTGCETDPNEADIYLTTVKKFLNGDKLFIAREKENSDYKPFPPEEIVERAKSKLGKCKGTYSLVSNNCEHFAYWCRYGKYESKQVDSVAKLVTAVGFFPLVLMNMFSYLFENKKSTEEFLNSRIEYKKSLGMKDIVSYFKEPSRLELLKQDSNKIAVAIRENSDSDLLKVVCCIFDKATNEISNMESILFFKTESCESDLLESFGDKDMIILE